MNVKAGSALKNQKGVSLIELVTSMGISGIIILVAATLIVLATQYFNSTTQKYLLESELSRGGLLIKTYFSQAIDLQYRNRCPIFDGTYNVPSQDLLSASFGAGGVLYNCGGNLPTLNTYQLRHIALFAREMSNGGDPLNAGAQRGTWPKAVSFTFQTPKSPNISLGMANDGYFSRSGLLMIHEDGPDMASPLGAASYPTGPTYDLSPRREPSQVLPRLTQFTVSNIKVIDPISKVVRAADIRSGPGSDSTDFFYVVSADFNYTMRSFIGGHPNEWMWCHEYSTIPGNSAANPCESSSLPKTAFRDYNRSVRVSFRNNRIYIGRTSNDPSTNPSSFIPPLQDRKRLMGFIYYFKPY